MKICFFFQDFATGATYKIHVANEKQILRHFDTFVGWAKVPANDYDALASRLETFAVKSRQQQQPFFWMHNLFDTHRSPKGEFQGATDEPAHQRLSRAERRQMRRAPPGAPTPTFTHTNKQLNVSKPKYLGGII